MKKRKALLAYMLMLAMLTTYVVLDTFVITRVYSAGTEETAGNSIQITEEETGTSQLSGEQSDAQTEDQEDAQTAEQDTENSSHGHGSRKSRGGPPGSGSRSKRSSSDSDSRTAAESSSEESGSSGSEASYEGTQNSYNDGNISVEMKEYTVNDTSVHVAEVTLSSAGYLKTAFAQGSYGRNVTATTSDIADSVNAILAINGDYYGAQEKGYVIRNGVLYRSEARSGQEDLVIYSDGSFGIINESETTAEQLLADGAVQTLSFGPALVENGSISVDADDEVGRAMASNPRTAIGVKADGTYLFVVSDGRTDENEGLSLLELAEFMSSIGAETAYNLDGGGSSTMVFSGSVVNDPTGGGAGGRSGSERKVSDIVYIGY